MSKDQIAEIQEMISFWRESAESQNGIDASKFLELIDPNLLNAELSTTKPKIDLIIVLALNGYSSRKIHQEFCKIVRSNSCLKSFCRMYQHEINDIIKDYILSTPNPFKFHNTTSQSIKNKIDNDQKIYLKFDEYPDLARSFDCELNS